MDGLTPPHSTTAFSTTLIVQGPAWAGATGRQFISRSHRRRFATCGHLSVSAVESSAKRAGECVRGTANSSGRSSTEPPSCQALFLTASALPGIGEVPVRTFLSYPVRLAGGVPHTFVTTKAFLAMFGLQAMWVFPRTGGPGLDPFDTDSQRSLRARVVLPRDRSVQRNIGVHPCAWRGSGG